MIQGLEFLFPVQINCKGSVLGVSSEVVFNLVMMSVKVNDGSMGIKSRCFCMWCVGDSCSFCTSLNVLMVRFVCTFTVTKENSREKVIFRSSHIQMYG